MKTLDKVTELAMLERNLTFVQLLATSIVEEGGLSSDVVNMLNDVAESLMVVKDLVKSAKHRQVYDEAHVKTE